MIRKDWTLLGNVSINVFYSYELSVKGSPQKSENVQRPCTQHYMQWHKETKNWLGDCYKDIFICYVAMYTCMAWDEIQICKHFAMPDNEESCRGTIMNAHDACKILSSVYKVLLIHLNPFEIFCPNI